MGDMFSFGDKQFKYQAFFEAQARVVCGQPKEKAGLAIASLSKITGVFDEEVLEKLKESPDLMAVASNLILIDHCNKNHDAVLLQDIVGVADKFEYKQLNAEHNRADVKGFIDEVGWSLYPSNELIDKEELLNQTSPIQLVIGGYLWRVVDPKLCNLIEEAANENSKNYGEVSTSFELLFNEYLICVGPLDARKGRLIKSDEEDYDKYDKMLPQNGGSGKDGGNYVFRVLKDILPVGAGIVRKPASGLKGIAVVTQDSELKKEETEDEHPLAEYLDAKENLIKISENSVNENKSTNIMVITSLNDIQANFEGFAKLPANEAVASIQKIMETKILELSENYAKEIKLKEDAVKASTTAQAELEDRAKGLGKAVEELQAKLLEIESKQSAAANEAAFNSRMAALDETFDLDDDDRAILVDEVKALESEAAFMPWMDKKKKLMKEKTKAYKKEKAKCMEEKLTKAGVKFTLDEKTLDVKEVFASLKDDQTNINIPNGAPAITENLAEKMKKLREGISVAGVKTE
jgi:hypothetical protein